MKRFILLLIKLTLIIAPIANLYIFMTLGDGKAHDLAWWKKNIGYVLWALGAYLILLMASRAYFINWFQVLLLVLGTAGLVGFYFHPKSYPFFSQLQIFQDHPLTLPVLPYVLVALILFLMSIARKRRRRG